MNLLYIWFCVFVGTEEKGVIRDISNIHVAVCIYFLLYNLKYGFSSTDRFILLLGRKQFSFKWSSFLLCCSFIRFPSLLKYFFSQLNGKIIVKRSIDFLSISMVLQYFLLLSKFFIEKFPFNLIY